jgi:hypothetical protein
VGREKAVVKRVAVVLTLTMGLPDVMFAGSRGGANMGSVRSVNHSGNTASNARPSGNVNYSRSGNTATRTTTVQGANGQTATGTKSVTNSGDQVTVNRNAQSSTGASASSSRSYDMNNGRVDSTSGSAQATNRYGQSANWSGSAERQGAGWSFEGSGTNRYGQNVSAQGYGARGPYGSGVVANIQGGARGNRTVAAGRYNGPIYATTLPAGARPYRYYGRPYYAYGGAYYRPYMYRGVPYYGYIPPPWGAYYTTVPVGAIALTVAGMSLLYSDGSYYQTTYVEGATQYEVVAPPAGVSLPAGTTLPADRATITIAGVTYYLYGNTFYRSVVINGAETFEVVTRPPGVITVAALPSDFVPMQAGSMIYFQSGDRYYLNYLDPSGQELYVVVDPPPNAVPAVAEAAPADQDAGAPPEAPPTPAGAPQPAFVTLTAPAGTPITVRVATEVNSGSAQPGHLFLGNLSNDLVANGRVLAPVGTRVYGKVAAAQAGTGIGGKPSLSLQLTDIEVGGYVVPLTTDPVAFSGQGTNPAKKVVGGAALGAGIGGIIDGGSGAGVGAAIGMVTGAAAASASPGNQIAIAAGTALVFRLSQPLAIDTVG